MKFVCLLPVRDEADIIAQSLRHFLLWADEIYLFDTGSLDPTWEIVQDIASREKRLKPLRKDPVYFSETRLRSWMFHQARQHLRDGDWFLRVDADEFHHIPPPEFVRTKMRRHETVAYHQYYDFRLTASEVQVWEQAKETTVDRNQPIEQRRRWFTAGQYTEPRLCRYRPGMKWPPTVSFPFNAGYMARARLPIRHYPHRDPLQLERRCRLRAVMMTDAQNRRNWSNPQSHHWTEHEWRSFVTPDKLPGLKYWKPGTELPESHFTNHLKPRHLRTIQMLVHRYLLPMIDPIRPGFPSDCYPQRISANVNSRLLKELAP